MTAARMPECMTDGGNAVIGGMLGALQGPKTWS